MDGQVLPGTECEKEGGSGGTLWCCNLKLPRFSRSPAGESQCGCPAMTEGTTANLIGRGEIASAAVNDPASRDRAGQLKKGWRGGSFFFVPSCKDGKDTAEA